MDEYGLSMNVLRKFLETTRTYFDLTRKPVSATRHRSTWRFSVAGMPARTSIEYRENAPA